MVTDKTALQQRVESGKTILLAEFAPPKGNDPACVRALARKFAGKVHALGVSDNRDGVCMAALAAAALAAGEGVEPLLHLVTRDRNRIALVSDCLGAAALGVRNILCTSGTHQTLGPARAARNVFDIDSVQMIQALAGLAADGSLVGESGLNGAGPFCLGGVAAPFADPLELQVARVAKKIQAGARFLITQPVYDLDRFGAWWQEITRRGLHRQAALIAGIEVLPNADSLGVPALAGIPPEGGTPKPGRTRRPDPHIPAATLQRLGSKSGPAAQRAEGIAIALETIQRLLALDGIRGIELRADGDEDAALEIIEKLNIGD